MLVAWLDPPKNSSWAVVLCVSGHHRFADSALCWGHAPVLPYLASFSPRPGQGATARHCRALPEVRRPNGSSRNFHCVSLTPVMRFFSPTPSPEKVRKSR